MKIINLIFAILLDTALRTYGQEAYIIIPPQSVNVSLNGVAEFNCTAVTTSFVWRANGIDITDGISPITVVNESQSIRMSTLTVQVSSINDATNITCTAIRPDPLSADESAPGLLLVQGLLKSVNNLTVTRLNSTTLLISWTPPFTLEGVPILSYNVTITNSSNMNVTLSIEGIKTTLLYSAVGTSEKYIFFRVFPINMGGAGLTVAYVFSDIFVTSLSKQSTTVIEPSPSAGLGHTDHTGVFLTSLSKQSTTVIEPSPSAGLDHTDHTGVAVGVTLPIIGLLILGIIVIGISVLYYFNSFQKRAEINQWKLEVLEKREKARERVNSGHSIQKVDLEAKP